MTCSAASSNKDGKPIEVPKFHLYWRTGPDGKPVPPGWEDQLPHTRHDASRRAEPLESAEGEPGNAFQ